MLPKGEELIKEYTTSLELLVAYCDPHGTRGSEVTQDPYCGLVKWCSRQAQTIWPANSMEGTPDELFIGQFPSHPGAHV